MARRTFISYKYSESRWTRDEIIKRLGKDATYYHGETADSPDIGTLKVETIKRNLADMIFPTSVMIVIISPNVTLSSWVKWEIKYATKRQTRNGKQSQPNGIVMAIDDSLIVDNKYSPNEVTELIMNNSNPYVTSVSNLLANPNRAIEEAYKKLR
ncbi:TIR domain-containing protein [Vagococcus fluvialis]|uniref:TIR domain-containing protein n=1 Tax=Vagococcus fluvialis TaxID=2738 RepID=UPI003B221354